MKDPGRTARLELRAKIANKRPPKPRRIFKEFNEERFLEACAKFKADPCVVIAMALSDEYGQNIELNDRAMIALKALKFLMPEKKAVEHSGGTDKPPVRFVVEH